MTCENKNHITVYNRLAFLERIIDGLQSARELDFNAIYQRWFDAKFFDQVKELGYITVSYNNAAAIDFIPSEDSRNRHQALALSAFLASCYADSNSVVESPHELGGIFRATFTRTAENIVCYVTETGSINRFFFDVNRSSQL